MAIALTTKQENFCQEIIKGANQSDAYRAIYNISKMKASTVHEKAAELMRNAKITTRIEELRAPVIENCRITMENHLNRLKKLSEAAEQESQYGAATKAEELRGKVCGLYTEKVEHLGKNGGPIRLTIERVIIDKATDTDS